SVRITYTAYGDSYEANDEPRHDGTGKGNITGPYIQSGEIDYDNGGIEIQFKFSYRTGDYSYIDSVQLIYYGYAGDDAVPTPATWDTDEYGFGYDGSGYYGDTSDINRPNPLNILRTIRSYDPCLACSIHVVDKKGKNIGKYEAVPMAGWDPK
ncbi:MAG: nickel-dependent hydrogenase large subunit, partial [Archaeoglobaceae archaeon]